MKDNLIDEERAKQEEAAQESLEQKLERLGKKKMWLHENFCRVFFFIPIKYDYIFFVDFAVENISERFARVVADYSSFQAKVKQRLSKLEVDENKSK